MRVVCRVEMLGGLSVRHHDRTQSQFMTQKVAKLLARLALTRGREQTREQVMEMLWPDSAPQKARCSLRVALTSLRKQLEPAGILPNTVLKAEMESVALRVETTGTDVAEFEQLLAQASHTVEISRQRQLLQTAVSLYRGDLLPKMYDDWVQCERIRIKGRYIGALLQLIALLEGEGNIAAALEYAHCAEQADPYEETPIRTLLKLYEMSQQRENAAKLYWIWMDRFREDFGGEPSQTMIGMAPRFPRLIAPAKQTQRAPEQPLEASIRSAPLSAEETAEGRRASNRNRELSSGAPPVFLTKLFGRATDIETVASYLYPAHCRLITLTGIGGVGKTRLAVAVAERLSCHLPAVYFVSLEQTFEPDQLLEHIARSLKVEGKDDLQQSLFSFLDSQPSLLILDNMEHLLVDLTDGAQDEPDVLPAVGAVQNLLTHTHQLACLITSRQRLDIPGEQEYMVAPLPCPRPLKRLDQLFEFASVQLYADRARLERSDFRLTPQNASHIVALCTRLEGVPLAIELAARTIRRITPKNLLEQLENLLSLPSSTQKGGSKRHRSLHAVMTASYVLLPPEMRQLFVCLSVFHGGWDEETLQRICGDAGSASDTGALLMGLVERSLVVAEEQQDRVRFRCLEIVREYAAEQWQDSEQQRRLHRRHRDHYHEIALLTPDALEGDNQRTWFERLEIEHSNLQAALHWSLATAGEEEIALEMAVCLWPFWEAHGYFKSGREWIERALAQASDADPILRGRGFSNAGALAYRSSDWPGAMVLMEQGIQLYRAHNYTAGIAAQLNNMAVMAYARGDYAVARRYHTESLELATVLNQQNEQALAHNGLGILAWALGDLDAAAIHYEQSLSLQRAIGNIDRVSNVLNNLGTLAKERQDYSAARIYLEESLAYTRALGLRWVTACALCNIADIARLQGDYATARAGLEESLQILHEVGSEHSVAVCLEGLAEVAAAESSGARAAVLFGAAESLRAKVGAPMTPTEAEGYAPSLSVARSEIGEQAFAANWGRGRALSLQQAVDYAFRR